MEPKLKEQFEIRVCVDRPIVVGQDGKEGRRQLIPITGGTLLGTPQGDHPELRGSVLPGGVDSQVIRPDGVCQLSARYAVRLENGLSFYIENNGIRTVPEEAVEAVLRGEFVDPSLYYFCTKPEFECYSPELNWLKTRLFVCAAQRLPDQVIIRYYSVEC